MGRTFVAADDDADCVGHGGGVGGGEVEDRCSTGSLGGFGGVVGCCFRIAGSDDGCGAAWPVRLHHAISSNIKGNHLPVHIGPFYYGILISSRLELPRSNSSCPVRTTPSTSPV